MIIYFTCQQQETSSESDVNELHSMDSLPLFGASLGMQCMDVEENSESGSSGLLKIVQLQKFDGS